MDEKIVKDSQGLAKELVNDCISRQAAIDYCYQLINVEHQQGSDEMNYGYERVNQTETILYHLENMPSAQPERKRGKWEPWRCDMYKCSECGYIYTELTDLHRCGANYCPNCGAKMEVDDGSD